MIGTDNFNIHEMYGLEVRSKVIQLFRRFSVCSHTTDVGNEIHTFYYQLEYHQLNIYKCGIQFMYYDISFSVEVKRDLI